MDPAQRLKRKKWRMLVFGIMLIVWGAMAESIFLIIIGATLIGLSLAGSGITSRRSGFPDYRPPTPVTWTLPKPQAPQPPPAQPLQPGDLNVMLLSPGTRVPEVRLVLEALLGITAEQAESLLYHRPALIARGVSAVAAEHIKEGLEHMGAQVEVVQPEKAPPPAPKPIDASTPGAAPGPAPTPGPTEPTERFPTPVEPRPWSFDAGNFDVVVLSPGPRKDMVAALLARILGVGLDQAQELLARRVSAVKRGISAEDADLLRQQLDLAGAAVEIAAHRHTPEHRSTPAPKAAFFDVVLTDPGPNKIATRKALKNHLGLDLLQAYNAVEQTPSILKQDIARTEAERLKSVLEAAGATVELRPAEPS